MPFKKKHFKEFFALFFISIVTLSTLNAESSLLIELSSNQENQSNGSIKITITNNANEPINVLKWNTPLEEQLSANIFSIKNQDREINYRGRLVKRGQPQDDDYTLFEAGESRTITITLPTYYAMLNKGEYTISYRGNFSSLSENLKMKRLQKSKKSKTTLTLFFTPSKIKEPKKEKSSAQFNGCSQRRIDILKETHDSAISMAKVASDAMNSASTNTTGVRYVTWFGKATTQRQKSVTSSFSKLYDALENKQLSYDCGTCDEENTFGYVFPDEPYTIYLCGSFWSANITGTDSRAGTLIHELSHFLVIAGTDDHVYGQEDAMLLARTYPDKAINNADNYEFFAEDTPHLTMETSEGSNNVNEGGSNRFDNARHISTFPLVDTINSAGATNLYRLSPSQDRKYTLYSTGRLDTYGILYDKNQNIIGRNDDISNSNYNFSLSYNFTPNETYYLEIGAYKTEVGEYTLNYTTTQSNESTNTNSDNNREESNEESSSTTQNVPSLNYFGLIVIMILTLLVAYKEREKLL